MVPGRKFCTSTSACATSLAEDLAARFGVLTSIDSERLPRLRGDEQRRELAGLVDRGTAAAGDVAADRLDLQDVGALVGEKHRRERARHHAGQIDDANTGKWSRHREFLFPESASDPLSADARIRLCQRDGIIALSLDSCFRGNARIRFDAVLGAAAARSARRSNSSSTSRSWSLPKNISFPTKKVGEPNAPRLTALLRQLHQPLLDVRILRARAIIRSMSMPDEISAPHHSRIVHLLRLFPHVMIDRAEIRLEHALELGRDRAAHQLQRIDGKERVVT